MRGDELARRALAILTLALGAGCAFSPPLARSSDVGAAEEDVVVAMDAATDSAMDAAMDAGFDRPEACQGDACLDRAEACVGDACVTCAGPDRGLCNGQCVSLATDPDNCGACGSRCSVANAAASCAAGRCVMGACNPGFADCNARAADGCEVNTASGDVANCGACGRRCPTPPVGASAVCNAGVCGVSTLTCPSALRDCNGVAADGCEASVLTDVSNCGSCGSRCPAVGGAASCVAGACAIACSAGLGNCDGMLANGCETDVRTSAAHCGGCGRGCALPNAVAGCSAGACAVASCSAGFGNCDGMAANGCETNLGADNRHCGACGTACPGGQACVDGACRVTCAAGQRVCAGQCVNVQADNNNCGACGNVCGAGTVCSAAACTSTCAAGTTACAGVCRDLANDPNHCMACGHACAFPNGVAGCRMGACVLAACAAGFADCDGVVANGCETNTGTDAGNCGACGNRCQFASAAASCAGGRCVMGACNAGFRDCDGNAVDGCEVNTASGDVANCGGCGVSCPPPPIGTSAVCAASMCGTSSVSCPSDRRDCNAMSGDGCEAAILTDVNNCGACGARCSSTGGAPGCAGGVCSITCTAALGNCDGVVANGCETSTATSATNCGACNRVCSVANATASCVAGACGVARCNDGFGDCDGMAANGCERNLNSDSASCGACGFACPAGRVCSGGSCQVSCGSLAVCSGTCRDTSIDPDNCGACGTACSANGMATRTCGGGTCNGVCSAGRANCNANLQSDGCETDINTTVSACGGCALPCSTSHVTPACSGGACTGACDAGFADCDASKRTNGCETAITGDVGNCGGCGVVCPTRANASATCTAGVCGYACTGAFRNCDAMDANGCEADLSRSGNCGACGVVCPSGQACVMMAGAFGCQ